MARWLVGLLLVSGGAFSAQGLYPVMSTGEYPSPIAMMKALEQQHSGVISEFEAMMDEQGLIYQFKVIDSHAKTITEYQYHAVDDKLTELNVRRLKKEITQSLLALRCYRKKDLHCQKC